MRCRVLPRAREGGGTVNQSDLWTFTAQAMSPPGFLEVNVLKGSHEFSANICRDLSENHLVSNFDGAILGPFG